MLDFCCILSQSEHHYVFYQHARVNSNSFVSLLSNIHLYLLNTRPRRILMYFLYKKYNASLKSVCVYCLSTNMLYSYYILLTTSHIVPLFCLRQLARLIIDSLRNKNWALSLCYFWENMLHNNKWPYKKDDHHKLIMNNVSRGTQHTHYFYITNTEYHVIKCVNKVWQMGPSNSLSENDADGIFSGHERF